jgi:hypothetical protein
MLSNLNVVPVANAEKPALERSSPTNKGQHLENTNKYDFTVLQLDRV